MKAATDGYLISICVQPNVASPDIGPLLFRPLAIPRELPKTNRKWVTARVPMIPQVNQHEYGLEEESIVKFLKPVEKRVISRQPRRF
jgi:hypothetical protein